MQFHVEFYETEDGKIPVAEFLDSLEDKMPVDFFAPNVCITSIVGQNGAGKSSLLDILFRLLNNLGFCLYSRVERNASDNMSYVTGLNADLYYSLDGKKGVLKCRNRVMALEFDHRRIMFAVRNNNNGRLKEETEFDGYEDYTNPNFTKQKEVAKMFFYTIATNYSRAINTRFPFAFGTEYLKLAGNNNSPDHSTKGTSSHFNVL